MEYTVYMLKDCEASAFKEFRSYGWAMSHGGVNIDEYEPVYTGRIEPRPSVSETLEAIFEMFNIDHPEDYKGRSMSTSDLVSLEGVGTFFCDSIGWKKLGI